jgi:hypothetical protein
VEKIVRDSVAARRTRATQGALPTQAELLKLWAIKEEAAQVPVPVAKTASAKTAAGKSAAKSGVKASGTAAAKAPPKPLRVPAKAALKVPARAAKKPASAARR